VAVNFDMAMTFERDPDNVNVNKHVKYLGQRPFSSTVRTQRQTNTLRTDRSTWTTKVAGNRLDDICSDHGGVK